MASLNLIRVAWFSKNSDNKWQPKLNSTSSRNLDHSEQEGPQAFHESIKLTMHSNTRLFVREDSVGELRKDVDDFIRSGVAPREVSEEMRRNLKSAKSADDNQELEDDDDPFQCFELVKRGGVFFELKDGTQNNWLDFSSAARKNKLIFAVACIYPLNVLPHQELDAESAEAEHHRKTLLYVMEVPNAPQKESGLETFERFFFCFASFDYQR